VPRQLPAAVADFTGRAAELEALTRILDQAGAGTPGTVVISAIGGTAGVGKPNPGANTFNRCQSVTWRWWIPGSLSDLSAQLRA
jgi:hypothetical protein